MIQRLPARSAAYRQLQLALARTGKNAPATGQFLPDHQRQRPAWRRAAEADIHQAAAFLQFDAQQQVRLLGQLHLRRHTPAHPRHQQGNAVAQGHQQAGEQAVQLEAVAATAVLDQLGKHRIRLDLHRPLQQHVEVLERQVMQRGVDQSVEVRGGRRDRFRRQLQAGQAGVQLLRGEGIQRGHERSPCLNDLPGSAAGRNPGRWRTPPAIAPDWSSCRWKPGRQPRAWRALAEQTSISLSARL
ncbi:hypothetical protein FQZ97_702630 [compost metagenome]